MHHLQKVTCVIATITFSTAVAPWFHVLSQKIMIALVVQNANVVAKKAGLVIAMVIQLMVLQMQHAKNVLGTDQSQTISSVKELRNANYMNVFKQPSIHDNLS